MEAATAPEQWGSCGKACGGGKVAALPLRSSDDACGWIAQSPSLPTLTAAHSQQQLVNAACLPQPLQPPHDSPVTGLGAAATRSGMGRPFGGRQRTPQGGQGWSVMTGGEPSANAREQKAADSAAATGHHVGGGAEAASPPGPTAGIGIAGRSTSNSPSQTYVDLPATRPMTRQMRRTRAVIRLEPSATTDDCNSGKAGVRKQQAPQSLDRESCQPAQAKPLEKLSPEERKREKRRLANRESARRVRQYRQDLLDELHTKVDVLSERNKTLAAAAAAAEGNAARQAGELRALQTRLRAAESVNAQMLAERAASGDEMGKQAGSAGQSPADVQPLSIRVFARLRDNAGASPMAAAVSTAQPSAVPSPVGGVQPPTHFGPQALPPPPQPSPQQQQQQQQPTSTSPRWPCQLLTVSPQQSPLPMTPQSCPPPLLRQQKPQQQLPPWQHAEQLQGMQQMLRAAAPQRKSLPAPRPQEGELFDPVRSFMLPLQDGQPLTCESPLPLLGMPGSWGTDTAMPFGCDQGLLAGSAAADTSNPDICMEPPAFGTMTQPQPPCNASQESSAQLSEAATGWPLCRGLWQPPMALPSLDCAPHTTQAPPLPPPSPLDFGELQSFGDSGGGGRQPFGAPPAAAFGGRASGLCGGCCGSPVAIGSYVRPVANVCGLPVWPHGSYD